VTTVPRLPRVRSGSYLLSGYDGPGAVERFSCAAHDGGWTYDAMRSDPASGAPSGRLHLRVDAAGVTTRLHVEAGGWVLRGGCVGGEVLWRRGEREHGATASGFWGTSPAYALALVARLALALGEQRRARLVAVTEPVLATRLVEQAWTRMALDRWQVEDLATGQRREVVVEDGLVVAGTGLALTRA
jgi:hypothetical protein